METAALIKQTVHDNNKQNIKYFHAGVRSTGIAEIIVFKEAAFGKSVLTLSKKGEKFWFPTRGLIGPFDTREEALTDFESVYQKEIAKTKAKLEEFRSGIEKVRADLKYKTKAELIQN